MKLAQAALYSVLAIVAVGCAAESAPAPALDLAAEEQAIRGISMEWLTQEKARNAAGIVALMAETVSWYREGREPIVGGAAIQAYLAQDWAENPTGQTTWATDRVEVAASGDIAVEYGTWSVTNAGPDGTGTDGGKYTTIFHKVNGQWQVVSDMSMSTQPDPAPAPAP
jgi:ketosteroid isomerase-like protein